MIREVNRAGIELIKSFEGIVDGDPSTVNLDPYADPIGILTIGWGHAIRYGKRYLRNTKTDRAIAKKLYPDGITRSMAEELLKMDVAVHSQALGTLVTVPLNDNQYAALASLVFNIGVDAFKRSSVLRCLNKGFYISAADHFADWKKADGRVLPGLVRRRAAEADLFLTES